MKKTQSEMKDTLIELKNTLQRNNSRVEEAENQINDMEHKEAKNNHSEQGGKRIEKNEDTISSLWDNSKMSSIRTTGVPEGEEKKQETRWEIYFFQIDGKSI